jgi:hypothetical protein
MSETLTKTPVSISVSKSTVSYQSRLPKVCSHKEDPNITDERDLDEILNNLDLETPPSSPPPIPAQIELEHVALDGGIGLIRPNDVVELHAPEANDKYRPRGDFLLIRQIKEELETGQISFTGYRLRRTTHMAPMFNRRSYRNTQRYNTLTIHSQNQRSFHAFPYPAGRREVCL